MMMDEKQRVFNIRGNYIESQTINVNDGGVMNFGVPTDEEADDDEADGVATAKEKATFGFIIYSHHSKAEIASEMERLDLRCHGSNSRSLMRLLNDLDKDGYIDIGDVSAAELYAELERVFGIPNIKRRTFAEAYRLIG